MVLQVAIVSKSHGFHNGQGAFFKEKDECLKKKNQKLTSFLGTRIMIL